MTQLANFARLGIITVISHSCSRIFTLIGVYKMARSPNNSNAKRLKEKNTTKPSQIDLEIEKLRSLTTIILGLISFFSVLITGIIKLCIAYQDFILQFLN
ncbi:hypothetical protein V3N00_18315 [Acinetobacter baumannii]|uniref:hypothetical protein n=1 Tax=Acinetobacter baumannii TaxID=470 RepID=UPI002F314B9A